MQRVFDVWGFIPDFLSEADPRPATEQFDTNYISGWRPMKGFVFVAKTQQLKYPGDPVMTPIARMAFRDEMILLYPHAWVLVLQKDGSWECSRMD